MLGLHQALAASFDFAQRYVIDSSSRINPPGRRVFGEVGLILACLRSRRGLTREIHALGDEAGVASYGLTYPDLFSGGSEWF